MSEASRPGPANLERSLGLFETTIGGVGIILGAGIYALVGEVAGEAGNAVWFSFLIAAAVAMVIGLVYAELASAFPKAGADYEYSRRALGANVSFLVGWVLILGNIIAASAVALALGGYITEIFGGPRLAVAVAALLIATAVGYSGIKEAVWTSIALTVAEVSGLVFIIVIGLPHLGDVDLLETPQGTSGVFSGAALVMFAYIGFEQIATLAEETQDAPRNIPRALLLAIAVTTALYLLVALAAVSALGWEALADSDAPLAAVAEDVIGERASDLVAVVAVFSMANTLLLMLIAVSRVVYGMASVGALPGALAWVHPRVRTPVWAIVLTMVVAVGFALSGDLGLVAGASNFAVFAGFGAASVSLIVLRFTHASVKRPFRVPLNVGRLPLLPLAGLVAVAFLMANLESAALVIGVVLVASGVLAMFLSSNFRTTGGPRSEEGSR